MRRLTIFTVCLLVLAACASADVFTFVYTGTNVLTDYSNNPTPSTNPSCTPNCSGAFGQLDATFVAGNQWQVNSGTGTYVNPAGQLFGITIQPGAGSDAYFIWDNNVYPTFNPLLDNNGLLFNMSNTQELNIFGFGPGQLYDAWTAPPAWVGDAGGFTLTHENVPDGGMTLMLLGGSLAGITILRRKLGA